MLKSLHRTKKYITLAKEFNKLKQTKMIPSKELLQLAKAKAKATFKPNKRNTMQSIRLTSDETSYTLFYQMGATFIGSYSVESLPNFFKNRDTYELTDNKTLKVSATMQRL